MMKSRQDVNRHGQFIPNYPEKYVGKYPIVIRSSWERTFSQWLDRNPKILQWSSESIVVKYFDPVKNKVRRYYPDFYLLTNIGEKFIVEVKPYKETKPPTNRGNKSKKTRIYESKTWFTNQAKFKAAVNWCDKMGMKFRIVSEKELFGK